jgi:outer membrane immunogenic protein
VLLYGTGGLAWTRMRQTTDTAEIITAGGTSFISSSTVVNWEFGWTAGIGIEARLWNSNWLGRIEYLHYDFGNSGNNFDPTGVTFSSGHLSTDVVRGGLSYKFDWSNPSAAPARTAMPLKARPVVVAAADWSGLYVGGHVGHGWARDPVSNSASGDFLLNTELFTSIAATGAVGGFQAGANWQTGAFVGGLEIDMSATDIKGSSTGVLVGHPFSIDTNTDKLDTLGTARVRAGFLAWPNLLLYGTGGLAWARIERSFVSFPTAGGAPSGGGEARLADTDWFLRAEYLHYDFGDSGTFLNTINTNLPPPGISNSTFATGHTTVDVVRTALSYKLN